MLLATLLLCSAAPAQVDLVLGPSVRRAVVGGVVEIRLEARAAAPESFAGLDAILSWDPSELEFLQAIPGPFPWFVAGFLPDPDGINLDVTDGEALYTALAPTSSPASVPPDLLVATLRFRILSRGSLGLTPSAGTFGKTRVLSTVPGVEITGDISARARVRVHAAPASNPGPLVTIGPLQPLVLGVAPRSGYAFGTRLGSQGIWPAVEARAAMDDCWARIEWAPGEATLVSNGGRRALSDLLPFRARPAALAFDAGGRYLAMGTDRGTLVMDGWTLEPLGFLGGVDLLWGEPPTAWRRYVMRAPRPGAATH